MADILKFTAPAAASFDPDTIVLLGSVFDEAMAVLEPGQPEIVKEVVATRIIALASKGERNRDHLRNVALGAFRPVISPTFPHSNR